MPRRALGDTMISAGALLALLLVLVVVDDRVGDYATLIMRGAAEGDVRGILSVFGDSAWVLATVAWDQVYLHSPLMIFVVAGTVLFLFMIRT